MALEYRLFKLRSWRNWKYSPLEYTDSCSFFKFWGFSLVFLSSLNIWGWFLQRLLEAKPATCFISTGVPWILEIWHGYRSEFKVTGIPHCSLACGLTSVECFGIFNLQSSRTIKLDTRTSPTAALTSLKFAGSLKTTLESPFIFFKGALLPTDKANISEPNDKVFTGSIRVDGECWCVESAVWCGLKFVFHRCRERTTDSRNCQK